MIRVRDAGYPASWKIRRAIRWCSASRSIVVSTPSGRMPPRSQRPLTPVPVPISTTARAAQAAASRRNAAPAPGATGARPTSSASDRATCMVRSSGRYASVYSMACTGNSLGRSARFAALPHRTGCDRQGRVILVRNEVRGADRDRRFRSPGRLVVRRAARPVARSGFAGRCGDAHGRGRGRGTRSGTGHRGTYPESDIAVLKLDKSGLPPVQFGNSDQVVVGDPVLAFGSPLALTNTVTYGIVSAMDRAIEADEPGGPTRYYAAIQTDAAVNHGNSGGPLVDGAGRVIGVNSVIKSLASDAQDAGNIGLAFAIPINQAKRIATDIIESGHARR